MSVPAWPRPRLPGGAEGSLSCPRAQGRPLRQHPGLPSLCLPGLCHQPSVRPAGQSETGARGWPRRLPAPALGPAAPAEPTPGRVRVCGPGAGPRAQEGRDGGAARGGVPAHARPGRPAARRQVAAPLSPRTAAHWPRRERRAHLALLSGPVPGSRPGPAPCFQDAPRAKPGPAREDGPDPDLGLSQPLARSWGSALTTRPRVSACETVATARLLSRPRPHATPTAGQRGPPDRPTDRRVGGRATRGFLAGGPAPAGGHRTSCGPCPARRHARLRPALRGASAESGAPAGTRAESGKP